MRRRRISVRRWVLGALFLGVVGLSWWLRSAHFSELVSVVVEDQVRAQIGEDLDLGRIAVLLWPPAVLIDNATLSHPATGEPIVHVARVRVPLVLHSTGPGIGRLTINGPQIHLHLEEDKKLREFRNIKEPPPNAPKGAPLTRLPFSSIEITDGSFRLNTPKGEVVIPQLDVMPVTGSVADIAAVVELIQGPIEDRFDLQLVDSAIGPEAIELPNISVVGNQLQMTAEAAWPLGGDLLASIEANVATERFNPFLVPPREIEGQVEARLDVFGPFDALQASVFLTGTDVSLQLPGKKVPVVNYHFDDFEAEALASRKSIDVRRAELFWGEGHVVADARISLPELEVHDAHILGYDLSLAHILAQMGAAPTPWVDFLGDAEISAEGTLKPLFLQGPFELAIADYRVGNGPIKEVGNGTDVMLHLPHAWATGTLTLEKDHIELDADRVQAVHSSGTALVTIGFQPHGPLDIEFDLTRANLLDFGPLNGARLKGTGRVKGGIHGPFKEISFNGFGDIRDFSVVGIPWADHLVSEIRSPNMKSLEFHQAQATVGTSRYGGDFTIDFRPPLSLSTEIVVTSGRISDIMGMFVELPGFDGGMQGTLGLDGPLYHLDGDANIWLEDIELYGERFESGTGQSVMNDGIFTLDELRFERGDQALVLSGTVEREWALEMALESENARIEDLSHVVDRGNLPVEGDLKLVSRINNTLFRPSPHGYLELNDVSFRGEALEDSHGTFTTADGILAYSADLMSDAVELDGTFGLWDEQPYTLQADVDRFPLHLLYPRGADGEPILMEATGELEMSGAFGDHPTPVAIVAEVRDVNLEWGRHHLSNGLPWQYEQYGKHLLFRNVNLAGGDTILAVEMEAEPALSLSGEGQVDLDLLRAMVPDLQIAEGLGQVSFSAQGAAGELEAVVDVALDASIMQHAAVPAAFEDVRGQLKLTDDRFELRGLEASLGGGTIGGTGVILADRWIPARYDLQVDVRDAQIQWVEWLPPAIGDAALTFDGPIGSLLLAGQVDISEMVFSDRIDWEEGLFLGTDLEYEAPAVNTRSWFDFDISINADKTVFLANNVAEGTASAELLITGDTQRPGMLGQVQIDEAVAFVYDREFVVERGRVDFADPWTWDPELDFDLVTNISSNDQSYRINYMVFDRYSRWTTRTRSDPVLLQADVNALLLFGVTTQDLESNGLPQAVSQALADLLLTDLFKSSQASEFAAELAYFDRVDIVTGVNARGEYSADPRFLFEKRFDELGGVELTGEINLASPEDQYYRLGWELSDAWTLWAWYATLQRERVLPIGGAYGVDVSARWESGR